MNTWYYRQADQEVGPFQRDVLDKLRHAGVIDDTTPVKDSSTQDWRAFGEVCAAENQPPTAPGATEPRYYYLDANRQVVGPFDFPTLRRLHGEGVIEGATLISGKGDAQWVTLSSLFGSPEDWAAAETSTRSPNTRSDVCRKRDGRSPDITANAGLPQYRSFEQFAKMMGLTLTFSAFYLIPSYSRDMKAITGRERMEFTALMILGIVTLGLLLIVMEILWAYDLERHGKSHNKSGRQESIGTIVLVLNAVGLVLGYAIDGFVIAFVVTGVLSASALWMLQNEINLYAAPPQTT